MQAVNEMLQAATGKNPDAEQKRMGRTNFSSSGA
jgi:hypothetical protein